MHLNNSSFLPEFGVRNHPFAFKPKSEVYDSFRNYKSTTIHNGKTKLQTWIKLHILDTCWSKLMAFGSFPGWQTITDWIQKWFFINFIIRQWRVKNLCDSIFWPRSGFFLLQNLSLSDISSCYLSNHIIYQVLITHIHVTLVILNSFCLF